MKSGVPIVQGLKILVASMVDNAFMRAVSSRCATALSWRDHLAYLGRDRRFHADRTTDDRGG